MEWIQRERGKRNRKLYVLEDMGRQHGKTELSSLGPLSSDPDVVFGMQMHLMHLYDVSLYMFVRTPGMLESTH